MTLEALRCFCAVVESGGFRAAAERLHRTQPAISQQIKSLERELGHAIVQRGANLPTPAGALLYERARLILNDMDSLVRELRDFDETAHVPLRVGASDTSAMYFLPGALREFAKAMPQVRVELITKSSSAIESSVIRGELDLGVVTMPANSPDLACKPLFAQRLVLVVPRSHSFARRRSIALSQLDAHRMILLDETTRTGQSLREHFARAGFEPDVAMRSGSFEVIKRYVVEGAGIAILPEIAITKADQSQLAAVRVADLPSIEIGAIWLARAYQTKAATALLACMSAPKSRD